MNSTETIAFYNLENLFDPEDGDHTLDADFTPKGLYRWDQAKYTQKINNLGEVISKIGPIQTQKPPVILGVCEVENQTCLQDLVNCEALSRFNYRFVHFESQDRRGLDTAFLYREKHFKVLHAQTFREQVPGQFGLEPTRDILHVEGELFGESIHVLINHWPSRLEGARSTQKKRQTLARQLNSAVDSIYAKNKSAKIVIVGDFNDEPQDYSLRHVFTHKFFNDPGQYGVSRGTARFKNKWVEFDQILLNQNLLSNNQLKYLASGVYRPAYLFESHGRHKGSPKRSFRNGRFQNGYSDHFPVYAVFDRDQ